MTDHEIPTLAEQIAAVESVHDAARDAHTSERMTMTDYQLFRGRCKELAEAACRSDSTLTLVRGHYYCPIWNSAEQHWWCERPDGTIVDPTARQFPSAGLGVYTPFSGLIPCSNCGKEVREDEADIEGRYAFCSYQCHGNFVGLL